MNKKILIFLVLSVLILASVGFLTYRNFIRPVVVKNIQTEKEYPLVVQKETEEKKHFVEIKDWYETKIDYPNNNKVVTDKIFGIWNDFAKENTLKDYKDGAEARKGLNINVDDLKYSFTADYEIATSTKYITYVYTIYNFTGGAHGSTTILPITLNQKNEIVSVEEILPTNLLEKVSRVAVTKLIAEKTKRMKEYKEIYVAKDDTFLKDGVKPIRDNYSVVWPVGVDDLIISFGQYQVGSYAEGIYQIQVYRKEIQ